MKWLLLAGVCATGAAPAFLLPDRPPLAHTGGFGEPSCTECHFDSQANDPDGTLRIVGHPDRYEPGQAYRISVRLGRAGLSRGGFELSARVAAGERAGQQAGTLVADDARVNVADSTRGQVGPVQYARHTRAGSGRGTSDTLTWVVKWTAPAAGTGAVVFHVAANAANDDDSPLGDFVYTTSSNSDERP